MRETTAPQQATTQTERAIAPGGVPGLSDDQRAQLRARLEDLARGVVAANGASPAELNPTGSPHPSHNDWF